MCILPHPGSYTHTLTTSFSSLISLPSPTTPAVVSAGEESLITPMEALVVGGSCLVGVLLVVLLLVVTLILVQKNGVCSKSPGQPRILCSPSSPSESERSTPNNLYPTYLVGNEFSFPEPTSPSPKQDVQQLQIFLQSPSPVPDIHSPKPDERGLMALAKPSRHRVVFIYSDKTPKEECDLVAVYRSKLESQGDIVTSIYDISRRQPTSSWLASEVQLANTIFCVCNEQFLNDWQNGSGCLSRSPVHALRLQVDSHVENSLHPAMLYAVVVLYEKHIQFVPEGSYLKLAVKFLLCEEQLGEMMRFIRKEEQYALQ